MKTEFLIISIPFQGWLYSDHETKDLAEHRLNELKSQKPDQEYKIISSEQWNDYFSEYTKSLITQPREIDVERWNDMLEVLPPCRWSQIGQYEVFHISERITGNLVSWYAKSNDKAYTFDNLASISRAEIFEILKTI